MTLWALQPAANTGHCVPLTPTDSDECLLHCPSDSSITVFQVAADFVDCRDVRAPRDQVKSFQCHSPHRGVLMCQAWGYHAESADVTLLSNLSECADGGPCCPPEPVLQSHADGENGSAVAPGDLPEGLDCGLPHGLVSILKALAQTGDDAPIARRRQPSYRLHSCTADSSFNVIEPGACCGQCSGVPSRGNLAQRFCCRLAHAGMTVN
mmetsp:Transcript_61618/g.133387  ORF Transcript_61618/g.133387 Transcript_61618/m.133387 type:complete len:209 (+) Transcript_61618:1137-1763(+)